MKVLEQTLLESRILDCIAATHTAGWSFGRASKEILQAVEEAGVDDTELDEAWQKGYRAGQSDQGVMTGQEWYDRFQEEIAKAAAAKLSEDHEFDDLIGASSAETIDMAARRAAGLEPTISEEAQRISEELNRKKDKDIIDSIGHWTKDCPDRDGVRPKDG